MLIGQGHSLLHSTRHSPIEYGKDIITRAPDGVLCAYQLKGNPGGRLTLTQFRDIYPQLFELVNQSIVLPGCEPGPHRSYLVTNGEVDEEVQRAIDDHNRKYTSSGHPDRRIELISRGTLLAWAKTLGTSLWPSELGNINILLELLVWDGEDQFPIDKLHDLLRPLLLLDEDAEPPSTASVQRRVTSAALLTSVSLRNFSLSSNHVACITAWTFFAGYAIASATRWDVKNDRTVEATIEQALGAIFFHLSSLTAELRERKGDCSIDPLTDPVLIRARRTLVASLLALYWFWSEDHGWATPEDKNFIEQFIPRDFKDLDLWGEGAIPQLLLTIWLLQQTEASITNELHLARLLRAIIARNGPESTTPLASPYFTFEETLEARLSKVIPSEEMPPRDDPAGSSYFAFSLLQLLARTNLKQTCKSIWPDLTHIGLRSFAPESAWSFPLWRIPKGKDQLTLMPRTMTWSSLIEESINQEAPQIPSGLKTRPNLLALLAVFAPFRATPQAIRLLGQRFQRAKFY